MICSEFKRKFSLSMYKNLYIKLGEMSFLKDFIDSEKGDIYPLLKKSEDAVEVVADNVYRLDSGCVNRLFCQFFPYATYEITVQLNNGVAGFTYKIPDFEAEILTNGYKILFNGPNTCEERLLPGHFQKEQTMIVSCRPGAFDVFFRSNQKAEYFCTFYEEGYSNTDQYMIFSDGYVLLSASGNVVVKNVQAYIDNGISMADMRPIRYENGEVMLEQGKIYFSASIRIWEGNYQGIFSWIPGTAEFELTGTLFFDCGDGRWRNYIASSILYHRDKR